MTFFDSNVIIDLFYDDPVWAEWSTKALLSAPLPNRIAPIVYAELAGRFDRPEDLDRELGSLEIRVVAPDRRALFAAGRAHAAYRRRGGTRERILADFLIGSQSLDEDAALVTRDPRRYRTEFPNLRLISP